MYTNILVFGALRKVLKHGFCYCDKNTMAESNLGKGFISAYNSTSQSITEGHQELKLDAGADAEAIEVCCLLACFLRLAQPDF